MFFFSDSIDNNLKTISGFGTFSKNEEQEKNKFNVEIEELGDDLENEEVKNVMGISEFGRKAKVFDIAVIKIEFPIISIIHYSIHNRFVSVG